MLKPLTLILIIVSLFYAQENFITAEDCGKCHQQIFQDWQTSMHARATSQKDPLFNGMYQLGIKETNGKLESKCIVCHSPMSTVFGSISMDQPYNQDGITCQFCHGTAHINGYQSAKNMQINLDTVYSHQPEFDNPAHAVAHREYFNESNLCLPCHAVMENPKGLEVCATGSEWKTFYETTKKTCQDCHMPLIDEEKSHQFPGTHQAGLLQNAVEMTLALEEPGKLKVILTNVGAGHAIPTGTPLRMVMLKVVAYDSVGAVIWENWKENPIKEDRNGLFMKIMADAEGNGPVPPWRATQTIFEKRLMPGEPTSIFYDLPDQNIYDIEVRLLYRFAPDMILGKLGITDPHFQQNRLMAQKRMKIALSD